MVEYSLVSSNDWSELLSLAAKISELPPDAGVRREYILNALCKLIGATAAVVFDFDTEQNAGVAQNGSIVPVGMTDVMRKQWESYLMSGNNLRDEFAARMQQIMRRERQVMEGAIWHRSSDFRTTMQPWAMDDRLHDCVCVENHGWVGVCLIREANDRAFGERERQVLAAFHEQAGKLYAVPLKAQEKAMRMLPPRFRPVLKYLLEGDAEKQVAEKLALSRHTIHAYAKDLYRRFNASSRGELLARFRA